jgi:hypothetical protein
LHVCYLDLWKSVRASADLVCLPAWLSLPQALSNGHISPALFVALRVLCAGDKEAAGWASFEDALKLPAAPAAAAAHAASSDGEEDEAEAGGQPELGAVQVWAVLDADGQLLAADAEAAAGSEEQRQDGYAALLNASMCQLLQAEVQQRLAAYAGTLQQDLQQLQEQQQQGAAAAATAGAAAALQADSEKRVAERAALVLCITEKEVLHNLLTALERRLASLPAEQPPAGKAGSVRQRKSSSGGQKRKQR